jgi:hypothetical protein
MRIDKQVIIDKYPNEREFSLSQISMVYGIAYDTLQEEYKKSYRKVERITLLYRALEDCDIGRNIKINNAQTLYNVIHLINKLYKTFPLKQFKNELKVNPLQLLYVLLTHKRASYIFKLKKDVIKQLKANTVIS